MPQAPTTREAITQLLEDIGPMTAAEIAKMLGKNVKTISSSICSARLKPEKFFYVHGYEFQPGSNAVPAIYGSGKKKDAKRMEKSVVQHMYYERTKHLRKLRKSAPCAGHFDHLIAQVTK
jgi:hypothetical protein